MNRRSIFSVSARHTILRITLFLLILIILLMLCSKIFVYKFYQDEYFSVRYEDYSNSKKDAYDIVFIGSSAMFADILPPVIWNEQGISGYNLSVTVMNPMEMYYSVLYAIEKHDPKLIVLDLKNLGKECSPDDSEFEVTYRKLLSTLPYDDNKYKLDMLRDILNNSDYKASWIFPLIKYHDRWVELSKKDFIWSFVTKSYELHHKGCKPLYEYTPQVWNEKYLQGNSASSNDLSWKYYQKIADLCRENNIEIMALWPPILHTKKSDIESINDFCSQNNIKLFYLKEKKDYEDIGLDMDYDFFDSGHLSVSGAVKYSKYVGDLIVDNYDTITNHRNDPEYSSWDKDYMDFMDEISSKSE